MTVLGDTDVKYHALIHQLPLKPYIDILIHTFFDAVNWQYDLLVEDDFNKQLESWRASLPDFSGGLKTMSPDFKMLPALLFQVLAHALLFHPAEDDRLEGLLVITGKTLHDLAIEYSEIGANILSVLGKRCITLATVQAGLLRAAFLKSRGEVIEAWHDLGATIRNAQEIGLHTGRFAPNQTLNQVKVGERHAQETYIGHKIWVVLHIWDIHMGVVLSRPITTQLRIDDFALSVKDEQKRRELFSHWQTDSDPPRPFDIILAGYNVAYRYFSDIHQLEQNGNRPEDYETIEKIHFELKENLDLLPSWCKLQSPDTRFDGFPGCQWLPMAREGLTSLIYLVFLALHRPFIFSMPASRTEAVKAGLIILESQERVFQQMDLYQCKVFNPVYASFDAIVLIAAICMSVLGHEFEKLDECVQAVERGTQRLGVIGQFNPMAKSAHRVAWNLCRRLQTRLRKTDSKNILETPSTLNTGSSSSSDKLLTEGSLGLGFDQISPPHPMHDLLYDDLSVPQLPLTDPLTDLSFDPLNVDLTNSWDFEGNFSDTSFWNLINELDH